MGIPLVTLVHIGIGSFLSMQAYFGGTFVDGTGGRRRGRLDPERRSADDRPGPWLGCSRLCTPELRRRFTQVLDADPREAALIGSATRPGAGDPAIGLRRNPRDWRRSGSAARRDRRAGALGLGVLVGTLVGWRIALDAPRGLDRLLFHVVPRNALDPETSRGLVIEGGAFALFAALFACHEGSRDPPMRRAAR